MSYLESAFAGGILAELVVTNWLIAQAFQLSGSAYDLIYYALPAGAAFGLALCVFSRDAARRGARPAAPPSRPPECHQPDSSS